MREVMAQGTTLLYVSHDLATVEAMCTRALWLDRGVARMLGETRDVISQYRQSVSVHSIAQHSGPTDIAIHLGGAEGPSHGPIRSNAAALLQLDIRANSAREARVVLGISEGSPAPIFVVQQDLVLTEGDNRVACELGNLPLPAGHFTVYATVLDENSRTVRPWSPIGHVEVEGFRLQPTPTGVVRLSPIAIEAAWRRED
jgi:hypothetical protein